MFQSVNVAISPSHQYHERIINSVHFGKPKDEILEMKPDKGRYRSGGSKLEKDNFMINIVIFHRLVEE